MYLDKNGKIKLSSTTSAKDPIPSAPVEAIEPFVDPLHEENSDRSYKFSYGSEPSEGSILHQEESDADGNIKGKYFKFLRRLKFV